MNKLELNAKIINNFHSVINGNNINNEPVYNAIVVIIRLLRNKLDEPNITKPDELIYDLIDAFDAFYNNEIYTAKEAYTKNALGIYTIVDTPDYFIYIRNKLINKLLTTKATLKDLSEILYYSTEIDGHREFKTLYERLKSGFYIS